MVAPNHVAPAGTPVTLGDLGRSIALALTPQSTMSRLEDLLSLQTGGGQLHFLNTGRAALTVIGRALSRKCGSSQRTEVVVPGYTCYSVAASLLRAGLKLRICDIDPETLDYDPSALAELSTESACAIITANLYGMPDNLSRLTEFARDRSLMLIDDAAQSLGARSDDLPAGGAGDVGLFSFDKGKVVTSMQGGCIAVRNPDLAKLVAEEISRTPKPRPARTLIDIAKFLAYATLLPPGRYWITEHLPFLGLGITRYESGFPITRYSPRLAALVTPLLENLEQLQKSRTANASAIRAVLTNTEFVPVSPQPHSVPAWIRFPVLAPSETVRDDAVAALRASGIGASRSYPLCLRDVPEIQEATISSSDTPLARSVARRLFTLPTHPYVSPHHVEMMGAMLSRAWEGST